MKVELAQEPSVGFHNYATGPRPMPVKRMAPFILSRQGRYVHRVRSAQLHVHATPELWKHRGNVTGLSHVSVRCWCGQILNLTKAFALHEPPDSHPVCATCEGRAVGAGYPPFAILVLKPIRYSPRVKETVEE